MSTVSSVTSDLVNASQCTPANCCDQIDSIKQRLVTIESKLGIVDQNNTQLQSLTARMGLAEVGIGTLDNEFAGIAATVAAVTIAIGALEAQFGILAGAVTGIAAGVAAAAAAAAEALAAATAAAAALAPVLVAVAAIAALGVIAANAGVNADAARDLASRALSVAESAQIKASEAIAAARSAGEKADRAISNVNLLSGAIDSVRSLAGAADAAAGRALGQVEQLRSVAERALAEAIAAANARSIPGATGATGATGIPGINGLTGVPGVAGRDGIDGLTGAQGIPGVAGRDGIDGAAGAAGIPGVQGIPGVAGRDGIDGAAGAPGIPGIQGIPGVAGRDGIDGAAGAAGIPGVQGIPGVAGAAGTPGAIADPSLPGRLTNLEAAVDTITIDLVRDKDGVYVPGTIPAGPIVRVPDLNAELVPIKIEIEALKGGNNKNEQDNEKNKQAIALIQATCCNPDTQPKDKPMEFSQIVLRKFLLCDPEGEPKYLNVPVQVIKGTELYSQIQAEQIAQIEGQQCKECGDGILSVPEWWEIRNEYQRPQLILIYREKNIDGTWGKSTYPTSIPWPIYTQAESIPRPVSYVKGNFSGVYVLGDNSKIIVHAKDATECRRVIAAMAQYTDPGRLVGARLTISERTADRVFQQVNVQPWRADYWSAGISHDRQPDFTHKF
jgi:Collagen triple helix repeat (20 copies)